MFSELSETPPAATSWSHRVGSADGELNPRNSQDDLQARDGRQNPFLYADLGSFQSRTSSSTGCSLHLVRTNDTLTLREITAGGGSRPEFYFQMYRHVSGDWVPLASAPVAVGEDPKIAKYLLWNSGLNSEFHNERDMIAEVQHARNFIELGFEPYKYSDPRLEAHRGMLDAVLRSVHPAEHAAYLKALEHMADRIDSRRALREYAAAGLVAPHIPGRTGEILLDRGVEMLAPYVTRAYDLNRLYEALADYVHASDEPENAALLLSEGKVAELVLEADERFALHRSEIRAELADMAPEQRPDYLIACAQLDRLFRLEDFDTASNAIQLLLEELPAGLRGSGAAHALVQLAPHLRGHGDMADLRRVLRGTAPESRPSLLSGLAAASHLIKEAGIRRAGELLAALHAEQSEEGGHTYTASSWSYLSHLKHPRELELAARLLRELPAAHKEELLIGLGNMGNIIRQDGAGTALERLMGFYEQLDRQPGDFFRAPLRALDDFAGLRGDYRTAGAWAIATGDWRNMQQALAGLCETGGGDLAG